MSSSVQSHIDNARIAYLRLQRTLTNLQGDNIYNETVKNFMKGLSLTWNKETEYAGKFLEEFKNDFAGRWQDYNEFLETLKRTNQFREKGYVAGDFDNLKILRTEFNDRTNLEANLLKSTDFSQAEIHLLTLFLIEGFDGANPPDPDNATKRDGFGIYREARARLATLAKHQGIDNKPYWFALLQDIFKDTKGNPVNEEALKKFENIYGSSLENHELEIMRWYGQRLPTYNKENVVFLALYERKKPANE
ncbi:MAG: hypothetical protein ACT4OY_06350 [Alphaproteobacteria bacterium]